MSRDFYIKMMNKGRHIQNMRQMISFLAKTYKTIASFIRVDIKLKSDNPVFDFVTVAYFRQRFFSIFLSVCLER